MNKIILIGRLTKDVELKYTQSTNTAVASFSLAVNRRFVRDGEERQADFFNVIAWNKLAETAANYLKKGQQVAITGRLQNRTWDDADGNKHYITEVIAEELEFIESRNSRQSDADILSGNSTESMAQDMASQGELTDDNDDLPF